jgi:hypothetical protein
MDRTRQLRDLSFQREPMNGAHHAECKGGPSGIMLMRRKQFLDGATLVEILRRPVKKMGIQWRTKPFAPVGLEATQLGYRAMFAHGDKTQNQKMSVSGIVPYARPRWPLSYYTRRLILQLFCLVMGGQRVENGLELAVHYIR